MAVLPLAGCALMLIPCCLYHLLAYVAASRECRTSCLHTLCLCPTTILALQQSWSIFNKEQVVL